MHIFYVTVNKWNLNCWLTPKKRDKTFSSFIHITERVCFCYPNISTEPHIAHSYFEAVFWLQFPPYAAPDGERNENSLLSLWVLKTISQSLAFDVWKEGRWKIKWQDVTSLYCLIKISFLHFSFRSISFLTPKFPFAVDLISFFPLQIFQGSQINFRLLLFVFDTTEKIRDLRNKSSDRSLYFRIVQQWRENCEFLR